MTWTAIVAADDAFGIGKDNELPWRVPADLRHFKNTTTKNTRGVFTSLDAANKKRERTKPRPGGVGARGFFSFRGVLSVVVATRVSFLINRFERKRTRDNFSFHEKED